VHKKIPILMYHQVTPNPMPQFRRYTVTSARFAAQMNWLAFAGYTTISLDDLCAWRTQRASLPKRPIIITFDDGYQECVEHSVPQMARHGFTAIFYLVAGLSGGASSWLLPELGCEFPLLDWKTARQLLKSGFYCGAHTMSHPRLADVSASACCGELLDCRRVLEDQLSVEVRHLAYPYGSYDENVRQIAAEAGYVSACSTRKGLSDADDDLLALHRVPVYGHDTLTDFICRLHERQRTPSEWLGQQWRNLKQWFGYSGSR
jgi:peptidoglycan/xylan/chitin deacetylase (PgdA/CDA1 family)